MTIGTTPVAESRVLAELAFADVPGACVAANSRAHWRTRDLEVQRLYGLVRAEAMRRGLTRLAVPVRVEIEITWPLSKRGKALDRDNEQSYAKVLLDACKPCGCRRCRGLRASSKERVCWWRLGWDGLIADDHPHCIPEPPTVRAERGPYGPLTRITILEAA